MNHVISGYIDSVTKLLRSVDVAALERVVDVLHEARVRGATVYIIGNGGSAATASHFATDLNKGARSADGRGLRVVSLTDNISWITALANDEGYENVFAGQLRNLVQPRDVVIGISVSGNSKNVIRGLEVGKALGALTIALLGFDGGVLRIVADLCVVINSEIGVYGPVEDVHMVLQHAVTACLAAM